MIQSFSTPSRYLPMQPAWLTLIPLNGLGTTDFEFVDTVIQLSRVPQNYLRHPLSDEILSPNDASTVSPQCHSPFFLSFNVFGATCNCSAEIIAEQLHVVIGCYPTTPDRSRSRQNFTDSISDSDSRRNGQLRPTPTPASTPTLQPRL